MRLGGEAREHLGGAVVAVVDQVIEAGEVLGVAAHAAAARRAPSEHESRRPDQQETQQQDFGADAAQAHARTLSEWGLVYLLAADRSIGAARSINKPVPSSARRRPAASRASSSDRSWPRSPDRGSAGPAERDPSTPKRHGDAMVVIGLDFHDRGSPLARDCGSGSIRIQSGPSSTVTPSLRSSRVGAAMRSHSLTRNVARPVMRVGRLQERGEHHQRGRDVRHAGHVDGRHRMRHRAGAGLRSRVLPALRADTGAEFFAQAEEAVIALARTRARGW